MLSEKKILVIGGGFSGIGCIKSLKEEGFNPVCYEKTSSYGGTWNYREETLPGIPSIMPTTAINHSKEMGSISNYIPDKNIPNYMRHHDLFKLIKDIGEKFDCFRHITYNREVIKVKRSDDYDETGRWLVEVKNTENGEIKREVYDGVMVCVGQFTYPKIASYSGIEKFEGKIIHTHDLKGVNYYKDKKVAVIGLGCSGIDAAVDISNVASQVYLSTRSGSWIIPRVGPYGLPFDFAMIRRFWYYMQNIFGYRLMSIYLEKYYLNWKFNHNLYNLRPEYHALSKDPITNDILPAKLITGAILIKRDVKCFSEKGVIFENETKVTEIEAVIMATGYSWKFPFLEEGIVTTEDGRINLYKCMYPPHLKHPSLVIIGFILPFGPGFPLGEIQMRWATQVFKGKYLPPDQKVMMEDIRKRHEYNVKRYAPSEKISVRVDFISYLDEISSMFDAKPNLWKLFFTDPKLFKSVLFGPTLPYHYRLQGPHKWEGARDAILTVHNRVRYPFSGTDYKKKTKAFDLTAGVIFKYLITFLVIAFWISQAEANIKYYLLALVLPYIITMKGFYLKYFICLLLLPFYVTWSGFISSYFVTVLVPILIASLT